MSPARLLVGALCGLFVLQAGVSASPYPQAGRPLTDVVQAGQAKCDIVIPDDPDDVTRLAAQELAAYLSKITGAHIPVTSAPSPGQGFHFWLAGTQPADLALRRAPPERDGYLIESVDGGLVLTGSPALGPLNAVYAFLERYLGVRWFMPGELGEVVPSQPHLAIGQIHERSNPAFKMRWVGAGDWSRRNRCNVNVPVAEGRAGLNVWHSFHTYRALLDPAKYFDNHPEYYSLISDRRRAYCPSLGPGFADASQLCTSNPEVVAAVVQECRALLDADPTIEYLTLSPNDGGGFCECDACRALDEPGAPLAGRYSRRLLLFVNQVARALAKTHPDVLMKGGAYYIYTRPPTDPSLRCEPNVAMMICHYNDYCLAHPIDDPTCKPNAEFRDVVEGWTDICDHVLIYEYYRKTNWLDMPWPIVHSIARDIPYYHRVGVEGLYTQYSEGDAATLLLNYYVAAKLLWDPQLNVDALLADFYHNFYGPAAQPMRRYYEAWERAMTDSSMCLPGGAENALAFFTPSLLQQCQQHLAEARKQATGQESVLARIRLCETSLDYTSRYLRFARAESAAQRAHTAAGLRAKMRWAAAVGRDLLDYLREQRDALRGVVVLSAVLRHTYLPSDVETLESEAAALAPYSPAFRDARAFYLELPVLWRFAKDDAAQGLRDNWFAPDFDASDWQLVSTLSQWCDQRGHQGMTGNGWGRVRFFLPETAAGHRLTLFVGALDEGGDIYLNGKLAHSRPDAGPGAYREPFEFDATQYLLPGKENVIAVYASADTTLGGVWRPVVIYSQE